MNTKLLLGASAIVMGATGIAGTFAPHELATILGLTIAQPLPLLVQLAAALLFGFAMVNWMARGGLIGGIYNRPLLVGNVAHFVIGALAAAKAVLAGEHRPAVIGIAVVYAIFAIGFGTLLFRSPVASQA